MRAFRDPAAPETLFAVPTIDRLAKAIPAEQRTEQPGPCECSFWALGRSAADVHAPAARRDVQALLKDPVKHARSFSIQTSVELRQPPMLTLSGAAQILIPEMLTSVDHAIVFAAPVHGARGRGLQLLLELAPQTSCRATRETS
jgi:hypothetical protein